MSRRWHKSDLVPQGDRTLVDPCLPRSEAHFGLDFWSEQSVTVTHPRAPPEADKNRSN